jgi:acetylornithine deacetylase/succinyl-diaminopimelate desuccinylase-like protein
MTRSAHYAILISLLSFGAAGAAPQDTGLRKQVEGYVAANQRAIVGELVELLSIPNVAADRKNISRNATFLRSMLERRGLRAEVLETDGNPLVYGELVVPGATRTLLFYAHYDGQPVNPNDWKQADPFVPVLRDGRLEDGAKLLTPPQEVARFQPEWRIYARSASDDKSPIVALCAALDALRASGLTPSSNVRVILDGEEEVGSPNMVPAIERYRDRLSADLMLILDGPRHPSGRPTLVYGARGILTIDLTVFGPKFALHSGHYGNWVPNPAMRLARLLSSMKDENGEVLVPGFYDGLEPLSQAERELLDAVPDDHEALQKLFGIAAPEQPGTKLQDAVQRPSLNIRGLSSGFVGAEARTIVPDRATAAIDVRLVKETPAAGMASKIRTHLEHQGFHVLENDPDDDTRARYPRIVKMVAEGGTNAYRTSPVAPESRLLAEAVRAALEEEPVQIRTSGGTVPVAPFIEAMGFPAVSVPTVNFDNNQHGENENLRIGHFFDAITTFAAILRM